VLLGGSVGVDPADLVVRNRDRGVGVNELPGAILLVEHCTPAWSDLPPVWHCDRHIRRCPGDTAFAERLGVGWCECRLSAGPRDLANEERAEEPMICDARSVALRRVSG
jgi:hypothetical protein